MSNSKYTDLAKQVNMHTVLAAGSAHFFGNKSMRVFMRLSEMFEG